MQAEQRYVTNEQIQPKKDNFWNYYIAVYKTWELFEKLIALSSEKNIFFVKISMKY